MPPTSTPPQGSEPPAGSLWPPELLTAAVERAVRVARDDARTRGAPAPPPSLRPFVGFAKLPNRAVRTVLDTLDADDGFRGRVAEGADEAALGRASWLFLTRPEGWRPALDELAEQVAEELRDTREVREGLQAQRRAEQLADTNERLREELAHLREEVAGVEAELARERTARSAAAAERDAVRSRVEQLEGERARAVRELKATEAIAATRLEELRAEQQRADELAGRLEQVEAAAPAPTEPLGATADAAAGADTDAEAVAAPGPWHDVDPGAVRASVVAAARAAEQLARALADAAAQLPEAAQVESAAATDAAVEGDGVGGAAPSTAAGTVGSSRTRPPRRVPVRLRGGVHDESPEGLAQLLAVDGLVAIVDGYNVTMEGWPALGRTEQRTSLVSALGSVQARVPATLHVVFDGDADGSRPSVGAPLPVRVHFSPEHVEADDVILEMVASLPTDTPVAVVSSDRRVADGARRLGANAVRSSVLLSLLRR